MVAGETIPTIGELKGNTILELFKNGYNALKRAMGFKQNKLVAGDNIVIDEDTNRISAIVGGEPVLDDYYTKVETNALLDEKANTEDVYSKSSIDSMMADKENIVSAGDNIEITTDENHNKTIALKNNIIRTGTTELTGNANITGNITVTGNITQNGESYETHAEKIYTENDYIILRDGAEGALASGDYSGIEVEKYDGTNNCRLAIDNQGVARVGDVGDEQPLLTRDESGDLTDGESLIWDATNLKAKTVSIPSDIATALGGKQNNLTVEVLTPTLDHITNVRAIRYGKIVQVTLENSTITATTSAYCITGLPTMKVGVGKSIQNSSNGSHAGLLWGYTGNTGFAYYGNSNVSGIYDIITYICE